VKQLCRQARQRDQQEQHEAQDAPLVPRHAVESAPAWRLLHGGAQGAPELGRVVAEGIPHPAGLRDVVVVWPKLAVRAWVVDDQGLALLHGFERHSAPAAEPLPVDLLAAAQLELLRSVSQRLADDFSARVADPLDCASKKLDGSDHSGLGNDDAALRAEAFGALHGGASVAGPSCQYKDKSPHLGIIRFSEAVHRGTLVPRRCGDFRPIHSGCGASSAAPRSLDAAEPPRGLPRVSALPGARSETSWVQRRRCGWTHAGCGVVRVRHDGARCLRAPATDVAEALERLHFDSAVAA